MVVAQQEALTLNDAFVGSGHLLLGLLGEEKGIAYRALLSLGITREAVREQLAGRTSRVASLSIGAPPFTPEAKRALEMSLREALQFGHTDAIETEHLLLGILDEGKGVASEVILAVGVTPSQVRTSVIDMIGGLPSGYVQPMPRDRQERRMAPADFGRKAFLNEGELDPGAWEVLSWRQTHLPLADLRGRKDWERLRRLELETVDRLHIRLNLDGDQWVSLREHHARRVQAVAHQARPDLVSAVPPPSWLLPQHQVSLRAFSSPGSTYAVLSRRWLPRRTWFLSGWVCWFGNRWAGLRGRLEWIQTRLFALRMRASYRGQPRPT